MGFDHSRYRPETIYSQKYKCPAYVVWEGTFARENRAMDEEEEESWPGSMVESR